MRKSSIYYQGISNFIKICMKPFNVLNFATKLPRHAATRLGLAAKLHLVPTRVGLRLTCAGAEKNPSHPRTGEGSRERESGRFEKQHLWKYFKYAINFYSLLT